MAIAFRGAAVSRLRGLTASVPGGALIGAIGENDSGQEELLRLAAGSLAPESGEALADAPRKFLGLADPLEFGEAQTLALYHTLARQDAVARSRAALELENMRRRGASILLASNEPDLLRWLCDEVWWLNDGQLAGQGDPGAILDDYQRHVAQRLRACGPEFASALPPPIRQGDGRAKIIRIEAIAEDGSPTAVWQSGSEVGVRLVVRFERDVADPVIGLLIRTRIGVEVFGTNTQLENVKLGPRAAGDTLEITFRMPCHLCPREYTLTAASHDPDGVWHDWVEEALVVSVADSRYTAGIANLAARVEWTRLKSANPPLESAT